MHSNENLFYTHLGVSAEAIDVQFPEPVAGDDVDEHDTLSAPIINALDDGLERAGAVADTAGEIVETGLVSRDMVATMESYMGNVITSRVPLNGFTVVPSRTGLKYTQELNVLELIILSGLVAVIVKLFFKNVETAQSRAKRIGEMSRSTDVEVQPLRDLDGSLAGWVQSLEKDEDAATKFRERVAKELRIPTAGANKQLLDTAITAIIMRNVAKNTKTNTLTVAFVQDAKLRQRFAVVVPAIVAFSQKLTNKLYALEGLMGTNQPLPENYMDVCHDLELITGQKGKAAAGALATEMRVLANAAVTPHLPPNINLANLVVVAGDLNPACDTGTLTVPSKRFFADLQKLGGRKASKENMLAYKEAVSELNYLFACLTQMLEGVDAGTKALGTLCDAFTEIRQEVVLVTGQKLATESRSYTQEAFPVVLVTLGVIGVLAAAIVNTVENNTAITVNSAILKCSKTLLADVLSTEKWMNTWVRKNETNANRIRELKVEVLRMFGDKAANKLPTGNLSGYFPAVYELVIVSKLTENASELTASILFDAQARDRIIGTCSVVNTIGTNILANLEILATCIESGTPTPPDFMASLTGVRTTTSSVLDSLETYVMDTRNLPDLKKGKKVVSVQALKETATALEIFARRPSPAITPKVISKLTRFKSKRVGKELADDYTKAVNRIKDELSIYNDQVDQVNRMFTVFSMQATDVLEGADNVIGELVYGKEEMEDMVSNKYDYKTYGQW